MNPPLHLYVTLSITIVSAVTQKIGENQDETHECVCVRPHHSLGAQLYDLGGYQKSQNCALLIMSFYTDKYLFYAKEVFLHMHISYIPH